MLLHLWGKNKKEIIGSSSKKSPALGLHLVATKPNFTNEEGELAEGAATCQPGELAWHYTVFQFFPCLGVRHRWPHCLVTFDLPYWSPEVNAYPWALWSQNLQFLRTQPLSPVWLDSEGLWPCFHNLSQVLHVILTLNCSTITLEN